MTDRHPDRQTSRQTSWNNNKAHSLRDVMQQTDRPTNRDRQTNGGNGEGVYHDTHCDIQPWHGLHTLNTLPRSTQPYRLDGMVE